MPECRRSTAGRNINHTANVAATCSQELSATFQGLIDGCLQLQQKSARPIVFLRGNHEAAMLDFLENPRAAASWLGFGGLATLMSYGVGGLSEGTQPEALQHAADELLEALPPDHLAFLEGLQLQHRVGGYFFCHAGINLDFAFEQQPSNSLLWGEGVDLQRGWLREVCVVHGHHIMDDPELSPTRIGIDTGAYFSGCLTAVGLEGKERWLVQTRP